MLALLAALLLVSAVPGEAWVRVFIAPIGVPFGPFWGPYAEPYAYPYRYRDASPPVVIPPPPPPMWYDCANPQGY